MPTVADASVRIAADLKPFMKDIKAADTQTQTLGQRMKSTFSPGGMGFTAAAAGIGAFTAGIGQAVGDLINMERISAQTDAAIRSTGGAANVTRDEIVGMAEGLEELTGKEMEATQEGANLLLTFTNVRNEVGAGKDIFNQATEAALDMSVALGMDMTSASMLLGKALNDPIKGMTALTRSGVTFTAEQKNMIKALVESGDLLSAQTIILKELEKEFGGSAEAFGQTTAGKMQKFQNAVGNFFEGVVTGAVDMVQDTSGLLNNFGLDTGKMGMKVHEIADSVGADFQAVKDHIRASMDESGMSFEDAAAAAALHFETIRMEAKVAAMGVTEAMSEGTRFAAEALRGGGPVVAAEAGKIAGMLPAEIQARVNEIRAAGREQVIQFALGVLEAQNDPKTAFEVLTRLQDEELTRAEQIAYLHGLASSAELAAGQKDGRPGVSLASDQLVKEIDERLAALGADAYQWGFNVGKELARGIDYSKPITKDAAGRLANAVRGQIGIRSEPKDPDSPLRGITTWGKNLVDTYAGGIFDNLGMGRAAGAALAASVHPMAMAPALASSAVGGPVQGGPMGSGGIHVHVHSVVPASSEAQLREIGEAVGPAIDKYLVHRGRVPRRGTEGGV